MTQQSPISSTQIPYQPTDGQMARASALRRFNRLYVYIPLFLGASIILFLLGWMFWRTFLPQLENNRQFLSGVADIVIIFTIMPMMLICALGPASLIGLVGYRYKKRREQKKSGQSPPPAGRLQLLLWRLDHLLDTVAIKTADILPKVSKPVIGLNAFLAYMEALFIQFKKLFMR